MGASLIAFVLESDCFVGHGDGTGMRRIGLLHDVAIQQSLTNAYGSMRIGTIVLFRSTVYCTDNLP